MYRLDEWIPIEDTDITFTGCDIVKVMFTIFEGGMEDISVKFLYEDGPESEFYHSPKWELLLE